VKILEIKFFTKIDVLIISKIKDNKKISKKLNGNKKPKIFFLIGIINALKTKYNRKINIKNIFVTLGA
jgi:hypothetical protein